MTRGIPGTKIIKLEVKKEVVWALLIGLTVGGLIAILAIRLPVLLEKKSIPVKNVKQEMQTPTMTLIPKNEFNITSPIDNSILDNKKVEISGTSEPLIPIVLESSSDFNIIESDQNGTFSETISLEEGANEIFITSVDSSGNTQSSKLLLFYTQEKL